MVKLVIMSLFAAICFTVSDACFCSQPDVNKIYCNSNFFGLIKVVKGPDNCEQFRHCYEVTVERQFKKSPEPIEVNQVTTSASSASCGISYQVGETYLVAGDAKDKQMSQMSCTYGYGGLRWSNLNATEQSKIENELSSIKC